LAIILVYAINKPSSFTSIGEALSWLEFRWYLRYSNRIFVVANKVDLDNERLVSEEGNFEEKGFFFQIFSVYTE